MGKAKGKAGWCAVLWIGWMSKFLKLERKSILRCVMRRVKARKVKMVKVLLEFDIEEEKSDGRTCAGEPYVRT